MTLENWLWAQHENPVNKWWIRNFLNDFMPMVVIECVELIDLVMRFYFKKKTLKMMNGQWIAEKF